MAHISYLFFTHLFATYIVFGEAFIFSATFKSRLFTYYYILRSFHIFWLQVLDKLYSLQNFSPSSQIVYSLILSFVEQGRFLISMNSNIKFCFVNYAFGIFLTISSASLGLPKVSPAIFWSFHCLRIYI